MTNKFVTIKKSYALHGFHILKVHAHMDQLKCKNSLLYTAKSVDLVHTLVGAYPLNAVGSALRWRDLAGLC
jgi:hypothetical protein